MRAAKLPVRLVGLTLAIVLLAQTVVESHQWLNGNEASRRFYVLVVAAVIGLLTLATLRLATERAGFRPVTLAAGASGGLAAATVWTAVAWVPPSMPRDAGGGLVLIVACAGIAGGLVACVTRSLRETCAAGLLAAATGTALVYSVAELTIQTFPGRIPDIVGPVMPAGSTAGQVLRENRIEIVDGYVLLLFLLAALSAGLLLVSWGRRVGLDDVREDAPTAR